MSAFICCKENVLDIASYLCEEFPLEANIPGYVALAEAYGYVN